MKLWFKAARSAANVVAGGLAFMAFVLLLGVLAAEFGGSESLVVVQGIVIVACIGWWFVEETRDAHTALVGGA